MAFIGIRPLRFEGNVAYVPLSQGYEAVIEAEDAPIVGTRNWNALVHPSGRVYAVSKYRLGGEQWRTVFLHRTILIAGSGYDIDHVNGDGLDCRLSNLRQATRSQNLMNSRRRSTSKSGYKGVSFVARHGHWRAEIKIEGKTKYLGSFPTPDEAHEAYVSAASQIFGQFARSA